MNGFLQVLNSALGQPFLYGSPTALIANLASSASASASSSNTATSSNIADLTRKEGKAEKLREEKQLVEDDHFAIEENAADTNEVQPTLFQKKFNKILMKIRLFSSISSLVGNDKRMEEDLDDFEFESPTSSLPPSDPHTFQKVIYPQRYGSPLKVNLKIGEEVADADEETFTEESADEESAEEEVEVMHRFGQIGVFFLELLGSLVGLAYGANAHLNNALQALGTTESKGL